MGYVDNAFRRSYDSLIRDVEEQVPQLRKQPVEPPQPDAPEPEPAPGEPPREPAEPEDDDPSYRKLTVN